MFGDQAISELCYKGTILQKKTCQLVKHKCALVLWINCIIIYDLKHLTSQHAQIQKFSSGGAWVLVQLVKFFFSH